MLLLIQYTNNVIFISIKLINTKNKLEPSIKSYFFV